MKLHWPKNIKSFCTGITLLASLDVHAGFFMEPWENFHQSRGEMLLRPLFQLYSSDTNFDAEGSSVLPTGLESYTRMQFDALGAYGLIDHLTVYARLSWTRVELTQGSASGESFGLPDQAAGLNYRLLGGKSGIALDFQLEGRFSPYDNATQAGEGLPFLGDQTNDFMAGGFLTLPIGSGGSREIWLSGGAAYVLRPDLFSPLVLWNAEGKLRPGAGRTGFSIGGGIHGIFAIDTNPTATPQTGNPCTAFGAGGSCFIGTVQPNLVDLRGEAGYAFSPQAELILRVSQSILGNEAPRGFSGAFGFVYHLVPGGKHKSRKGEYRRSNRGFVQYDVTGKVTRVNDRFNVIRINKGRESGVRVGDILDIFSINRDGRVVEAVARGRVTSVKESEAALKVQEYYKEVWIEKDFIVKRPLR